MNWLSRAESHSQHALLAVSESALHTGRHVMANGRLRNVLAGLDLDVSWRRKWRGASPHHDAVTAHFGGHAGRWLTFLAECMSELRGKGRRRRSSWRIAQNVDPCESRILLSGMAPFAVANSYSLSRARTRLRRLESSRTITTWKAIP